MDSLHHSHFRQPMLAAASLARDAFWVAAVCILAVFVFFVVIGAIPPAEAVGLSIAMAVLAAMWVAHALVNRGPLDNRDPRLARARERRGF